MPDELAQPSSERGQYTSFYSKQYSFILIYEVFMFSNTYKKSHHKPHMTIYHTPPPLLPLLVLRVLRRRTTACLALDMYVLMQYYQVEKGGSFDTISKVLRHQLKKQRMSPQLWHQDFFIFVSSLLTFSCTYNIYCTQGFVQR